MNYRKIYVTRTIILESIYTLVFNLVHIRGSQNKNNKNSSKRKIGEGEKNTDREKSSQSSVPSSYILDKEIKSFKLQSDFQHLQHQPPIYERRTKLSPFKKLESTAILPTRSGQKSKIFSWVSYNNTTIHERNIPITNQQSSTHPKIFVISYCNCSYNSCRNHFTYKT